MKKIKYGYQIWIIIIFFLFTSFLLNAAVSASLYYAGYYLLKDNNKTLLFAGIYLVTALFRSLNFDCFFTYFIHKFVNKKVVFNLKIATQKMNNMSIKHYDHNIGSGNYLSSIYQNYYHPFYFSAMQVYHLANMILFLLLNLGFFFYFNFTLGITSLLAFVFIFLPGLFFYKIWLRYQIKINNHTNNWFEKLSQLFKLFNLYHVNLKTNKIIDKNQTKLRDVKLLEKKFGNSYLIYFSIIQYIMVFCQITFYLVNGLILINTANAANIIVGLSFFSIGNLIQLLYSASYVSGTFADFRNNKKLYENFWKFANGDHYPEDQLTKYEQPFKSINIHGLKFNYPDKPAIFKNFNFTIEKNKKYLLMGNNGSGKSTLTKLLTGIERNYSGNILFNNDIQVKELKQESLCHYFNWVTNKNILLDDTLRNNLTLYKDHISDDQIKASLTTMNLSELDQFDHVYREGKNGLSVGQVQRLDIARCLLEPKPILVLDEALSNVDVPNQERILNHFLSQKDLTLIVITHHLTSEWQQRFDQVIQL